MSKSSVICRACKDGADAPFDFTMAFQPIVDVRTGLPFAYEALVRGPENQGAGWVLGQVTDGNRYAFDQNCRVRAITLAKRLGLDLTGALLSINFMPGAVYSPAACIQLTLKTARAVGFPLDRLIFEITEAEHVRDKAHLQGIVDEYHSHGFKLALDDFGAGYSGLNLLAGLKPDLLKLDAELTRDIDSRPTALAVVRSMAELCRELSIGLIAEGVETLAELETLRSCGIHLIQGYLLAKPAFEALPALTIPGAAAPTGPAAHPIEPPAILPILAA